MGKRSSYRILTSINFHNALASPRWSDASATISPEGRRRRRVPKSRMQFIIEAAAGSAFTFRILATVRKFRAKIRDFLVMLAMCKSGAYRVGSTCTQVAFKLFSQCPRVCSDDDDDGGGMLKPLMMGSSSYDPG